MRTFPASGVAMMLALAWGIACSPKLRVNLSGRTVDQVPVTQAGVSALPTGEAFEVLPILAWEKEQGGETPAQLHFVRLRGHYLIAGEGFTRLWWVSPKNENEATFEDIAVVPDGAQLRKISVEKDVLRDCAIVGFEATSADTEGGATRQTRYVTASGKVRNEPCR